MRTQKHHARIKRVIHHPLARLTIFIAAVVISVFVGTLIHAHAEAIGAGAVSLGAVCARGLEALTDVICDRVFPEV